LNEGESKEATCQTARDLRVSLMLCSLPARAVSTSVGLSAPFVAAQVLDPSGAALQDGRGESQPVIHLVGAVSYKAVFSVLERASSLGDPAPCVTTMSGLDVLRRARLGTGIVMDAGYPGGPEVDPRVVEARVARAPGPGP